MFNFSAIKMILISVLKTGVVTGIRAYVAASRLIRYYEKAQQCW